MRSPGEFRKGKPGFYPDQSIYAEFACAEFGLDFRDLDRGSGQVFTVASRDRLYLSSWGHVQVFDLASGRPLHLIGEL